MSLILDGQVYDLPMVRNYTEDVHIPEESERNARRHPVRMGILHSTGEHAPTGMVLPGRGAPGYDVWFAEYAKRKRNSSWHFSVGYDGMVAQSLDPVRWVGWHASDTPVNERSFGIELAQLQDGSFYEATLLSAAVLTTVLLCYFGIQAQLNAHEGKPFVGKLPRLETHPDLCTGVFAHSAVPASNHGDPGLAIFKELLSMGYEGFNFNRGNDLVTWKQRQSSLGTPETGVPSRLDQNVLLARHYECGLWIYPPSFWRKYKRLLLGLGFGALVGAGGGYYLGKRKT